MRFFRRYVLSFSAILVIAGPTPPASAEGRAQGGIVIRDNAPVYTSDEGEKLEIGLGTVARGYPVAGVTVIMGKTRSFMAETQNGRVHVLFLGDGNNRSALRHRAWMNPADVAFFTYECGCGERKEPCAPVVKAGWTSERWNPCFQEAYDKKLAELKSTWGAGDSAALPAVASSRPAGSSNEKALTNADVVSLFTAGLGEDLVISKIQQAPSEALDVSVDGLLSLKKQGVSKPVIDAILKRTSQRGSSTGSMPPTVADATSDAGRASGVAVEGSGLRRIVALRTGAAMPVSIVDGPVTVASVEVLSWPTADVLQRAAGKPDALTQVSFRVTNSNSEKKTAKYFCQVALLDDLGTELGVGEEVVSFDGRETADTHRMSLKMKLFDFPRASKLRFEMSPRPN